jgi:putative Holliday junction resolvase
MTILGIDYGTKTVGLSHSDPSETMAWPVANLPRQTAIAQIQTQLKEHNYRLIIMGLPQNMKGLDTAMTAEVRAFREELSRRVDIPIEWVDERLTSSLAGKQFVAAGLSTRKSRPIKDSAEATLILQGYLDTQKNAKK